MSSEYRPAIADYFDELENHYGNEMSFDKLSDDELEHLAKLAEHAIKHDPKVTQVEKANLGPLMTLIEMQRKKRNLATPSQH